MVNLKSSERRFKTELENRIEKCHLIIDKFKENHGDYLSGAGLVIFSIILSCAIAIGIIIYTPTIISYGIEMNIDSKFYLELLNNSKYMHFPLYAMSTYFAAYALRKYLTLRWAQGVNACIRTVQNIKENLASTLDNIDIVTKDIMRIIASTEGKNTFTPELDIDNELKKYEGISNANFRNPFSIFDVIVDGLYWVSSFAFGALLIYVSKDAMSSALHWKTPHDMYYVSLVAYTAVALLGFYYFHKYLKTKKINRDIMSYTLSLLCVPITFPVLLGAFYLIGIVAGFLIIGLALAFIVMIIIAMATS